MQKWLHRRAVSPTEGPIWYLADVVKVRGDEDSADPYSHHEHRHDQGHTEEDPFRTTQLTRGKCHENRLKNLTLGYVPQRTYGSEPDHSTL